MAHQELSDVKYDEREDGFHRRLMKRLEFELPLDGRRAFWCLKDQDKAEVVLSVVQQQCRTEVVSGPIAVMIDPWGLNFIAHTS